MDIGAVNKGYKGKYNKGKGRSPTKEKEKAKATKAKDTATGTTKAKERLDKECHSKERSTKEDT